MTLEANDDVLEALKVLVVYCLCNADRKFYNKAEVILKWLQDNGVME